MKKAIVTIGIIGCLIAAFVAYIVDSGYKERDKVIAGRKSDIETLIEIQNQYVEEQFDTWENEYEGERDWFRDLVSNGNYVNPNTGSDVKVLLDDYVTTSDEMLDVLHENGIELEKFACYDYFVDCFKKAEENGYLIRYVIPDLTSTATVAESVIQLDGIDVDNQVVEITFKIDSVAKTLTEAWETNGPAACPYVTYVYSGDDYKTKTVEETVVILEEINNKCEELGSDSCSVLRSINKENILNMQVNVTEEGTAEVVYKRVPKIGEDAIEEKIYLDCIDDYGCILSFEDEREENLQYFKSKMEKVYDYKIKWF